MKKILVLALCAVAAFSIMTGCANKKQEVQVNDNKEDFVEAPAIDENEVVEDISVDEELSATEENATEEYPQIAYINEVSYYGTGQECMQVPRKAPDGTIETFTPAEIMPDAPFSANFGQEYGKLEYMFLDDGQLIIHIGDQWMIFEAK